MRWISVAAAPLAFFLPSDSKHINIGKLALIGMLVTTFFLFTSAYNFPGGACHYPNWAEAIVHGNKLPTSVMQREVMFPLLYILGGFPFTHSFIGLTLILAFFAVLISVLVYLALEITSPTVAFYTGLACIVSLSPFTYMKFFYPDEAYIFFNLLACTLLIKFIQSKNHYRWLYFFTFAALAASFTRTAGNLIFPVLLAIAFFSVRGLFRHYLTCILIFAIGAGLYQWHRYEIFDIAHQTTIPSSKGFQTIYPIYLYLGDFGLKLSTDIGPNTKRLEERLRAELSPNVRKSAFMKRTLPETPMDFKEKYIYSYTPDQLIEQIFTKPNEEYYYILLDLAGADDKFLLDIAKEIAIAHPWYIVQYSMRNFRHALFDPGYASTRYNVRGYGHSGLDFMPGSPGWNSRSEDSVSQYGPRAVKEMEYYPLTSMPKIIQKIFSRLQNFYLKEFNKYLRITNVLIVAAWIAACLGMLSWFFSDKKFFQTIQKMGLNKWAGPIFVASAFVIYEDLMTSVFCQPVYRYFHITEPLRMVIAGFGAAFLISMLSNYRMRLGTVSTQSRIIRFAKQYDFLSHYFTPRRNLWLVLLISLNVILFSWWVMSMLAHTA